MEHYSVHWGPRASEINSERASVFSPDVLDDDLS